MAIRLTCPVLRGEVISGPDAGTVAFGTAADWQRAHGGSDTVRFAIVAATGGKACRFSDRRGSVWRLDLYQPGRELPPLPKTRPPQDRPAYEAVRAVAMTMPDVPFGSHRAIKAAADALEGRRA